MQIDTNLMDGRDHYQTVRRLRDREVAIQLVGGEVYEGTLVNVGLEGCRLIDNNTESFPVADGQLATLVTIGYSLDLRWVDIEKIGLSGSFTPPLTEYANDTVSIHPPDPDFEFTEWTLQVDMRRDDTETNHEWSKEVERQANLLGLDVSRDSESSCSFFYTSTESQANSVAALIRQIMDEARR